MKFNILILSFLSSLTLLFIAGDPQYTVAQSKSAAKEKVIRIPFVASRFDTTYRKAEFITYEGVQAMKIQPFNTRQTRPVTLKDFNFTNGTIEFDAALPKGEYENEIAINFHQHDIYNFESLYLRTQDDESVQRNDAIQYTPVINSVNLWDIMTPFRGYAPIHNEGWNHFKLVVSGAQMLVYINGDEKPTQSVSRLEGGYSTGSISFDGEAIFANLVIKPDQTEGLSPVAGIDVTDNDPNYIRHWQVSYPRIQQKGSEMTEDSLPKDTVKWMPIAAERRGLINLNRRFGSPELTSYPVHNRYVWLKTNIKSTVNKVVKLDLGFNKEMVVFANERLIYRGKNDWDAINEKNPDGRLAITNLTLEVLVKPGDNEILIGVASPLYGWGVMARVENERGLTIAN